MQHFEQPIYLIYSRKRLNLNFRNFGNRKNNRHNFNSKKLKKMMPIIIIFFIAIIVCYTIWKSFIPIFEILCKDEAKMIATIITNEETTNVMNKYNYETFFNIEKAENGDIQMISANVLRINQITSDIALNIQKSLRNEDKRSISIATGSLTGIRILAGFGPRIPVKLSTAGNVETDLKSEFTSQGVNQTIHRVYLEVSSTVNILTPFSTIQENIQNQILFLENVILGQIPSSYYNFDGINSSNQALELVE